MCGMAQDMGAAWEKDALAAALEAVGDRWTLLVVAALQGGPLRFTDLGRAVPGIASNVLAERLRRLEAGGLVESRTYSERPPRAEYRLTEVGRTLDPVIRELRRWRGASPGQLHGECGEELELRSYCPFCDEILEPTMDQGPAEELVDA